MIPHPNPIIVDPAATVSVVCAVAETMDPTIARTSPVMTVYLRPKMSLRLPASEKETEEAIDQPPSIHVTSAVSPKSFPMGTRMPETRMKPSAIGQTYDSVSDWTCQRIVRWVGDKVHALRPRV